MFYGNITRTDPKVKPGKKLGFIFSQLTHLYGLFDSLT